MNDVSSHLDCYRPSGAIPLAGIAAFPVEIAVSAILAAMYAFVNHHDPLLYLNALLMCGFALYLGWIVSWGVRTFHIRNTLAAAAMGAAVFFVSYTVHWFFYISTVLVDWETDSPYDVGTVVKFAFSLMRDPEGSWKLIRTLNEEGVWSIGSRSSVIEVKGLLLAVLWVGEALAFFFFAVTKPWEAAGKPYSERLGKWMEARELPVSVNFIDDLEEFKRAVSRGDYSALTTPLSADTDAKDVPQERAMHVKDVKYAKTILYSDPLDPCVSVKNVSVRQKKKKTDVSAKEVVRYLKVSPMVAQNITNALSSYGS
jgi:hypothetical protein